MRIGLGQHHMAHKAMLKSKAKPLAQNPRQKQEQQALETIV